MKKQDEPLDEQELATSVGGMDLDLAGEKTNDGGDVVIEDTDEQGPSVAGFSPLPDPDHVTKPGRRRRAGRARL